MIDIHFTKAILEASYELNSLETKTKHKEDFDRLSEYEQDPIGEWVKLARAKNEIDDSEDVVLKLLVELHRKVDKLENTIQGTKNKIVILDNLVNITHIHYEYFKINKDLEIEQTYYFKIYLPVFPKREIPIYVKYIGDRTLRIELLHNKDTTDWDNFIAAKQRAYIREQKKLKNNTK